MKRTNNHADFRIPVPYSDEVLRTGKNHPEYCRIVYYLAGWAIYKYADTYTPDDLTQELVEKALKIAERVQAVEYPTAFLKTAFKNHLKNIKRNEANRRNILRLAEM